MLNSELRQQRMLHLNHLYKELKALEAPYPPGKSDAEDIRTLALRKALAWGDRCPICQEQLDQMAFDGPGICCTECIIDDMALRYRD